MVGGCFYEPSLQNSNTLFQFVRNSNSIPKYSHVKKKKIKLK